jgi:hypothetical protein
LSRITLSGNASGTGNFTLASPNSNTDRTLTLPDAAGLLYNQGSIVGTVSQSGGVPTGAVVETGSNANGKYTKFADGTMICRITRLLSPNNTTNGTTTWTFPSTFANTDITVVSSNQGNAGQYFDSYTVNVGPTTTSISLVQSNAADVAGYNLAAIGNWF